MHYCPVRAAWRVWSVFTVTGAAAFLLSCSDQSYTLAPRTLTADTLQFAGDASVTGCSVLELTVETNGVRSTGTSNSQCGPLSIEPVGVSTFDAKSHSVHLQIAIRNKGRLRLYGPLLVNLVPPSSSNNIVVAEVPSGRSVAGGPSMTVTSYAQPYSGTNPKTPLAAHADRASGYIRPSALSSPVGITVALPPGIKTQRVALRLTGWRVFTVPLRPPSSVPVVILREQTDSTHFAYDGRAVFARDKLFVKFAANATIEDRQAIVDAFDGEVIGGFLGQYYLRIADSRSDRAGAALISAYRQVRTMPGVKSAEADILTLPSPQYARPVDGATFKTWQLQPQNATGDNWGEEAVSAPLAWGCATGDTVVKVGVVDQLFDSIPDLAPNMAAGTQYDNYVLAHGTQVASIIGAVGNNGVGMTGMMWRARIVANGYDDTLPRDPIDQRIKADLLASALSGARVINLSAGINWQEHVGHLPLTTGDTAGDNMMVTTDSTAMAFVIDTLRGLGIRPLFVLSAGNDAINTKWSGFTAAAADTSRHHQILVVTANANNSSAAGTLASFADTGVLVDLAAPGVNVTGPNDVGTLIDTLSGTSYAAAFVSGTAGLIMNFNVRDTIGDSVRTYIVGGATDGGRTAGAYPILNAYLALRRAARSHDAPLCGNRVWVANNEMVVERNDATGDTSVVASSMPIYVFDLVPVQGGKSIFYEDSTGGVSAVNYSAGTWSVVTGQDTYFDDSVIFQPIGAAWNLANGYTHDADSTLFICSWADCGSSPFVAYIYALSDTASTLGTPIDSVVTTDTISTWTNIFAAQYGSITFTIGTRDNLGVTHDTIYSITAPGSHTVLAGRSGGYFFAMQPSEDGTTIALTWEQDGGTGCDYEFWNTTFTTPLQPPIASSCNIASPSAIAQGHLRAARRLGERGRPIAAKQGHGIISKRRLTG